MNNGTAPPPQGKSETCLWPSMDGCAISLLPYYASPHCFILPVQYNLWWPPFFNVFFPANYAGNRRTVTEAYFRLSLSPIVSRRGLTILEKEGGRENDRDREEGGRREREKGFRVRDKNSPRSSMTIAFYSSTVTATWLAKPAPNDREGKVEFGVPRPPFSAGKNRRPLKLTRFSPQIPLFRGFSPIPSLTLSTDLYHSTDAVHTHRQRNGPEFHINT